MSSTRTSAGRHQEKASSSGSSGVRTLSDGTPVSGVAGPSDIRPQVPRAIILKLLAFTLAMIIAPIGSYFLIKGLTDSSTAGGAVAAVTANFVLFGYIIVAFQEDQEEQRLSSTKKSA